MLEIKNNTNKLRLLKDNNNMKLITTNNLKANIYPTGEIKLSVYSTKRSPYGYSSKELLLSDFAVKQKDFTYWYVCSKVAEVYATFPNEEIHEFITKVKQYKNG